MKPLAVLFSAILHLTLILSGAWVFELAPAPNPYPVMQVDLKLESPEPKKMPQSQEAPDVPLSAKEQRRRKIHDVLAQATLPHEFMHAVKLISPHKVDVSKEDVMLIKDSVFFGSNMLKQGNEVRLGLRGIRAMEFGVKDFLGSYKVGTEDRFIKVEQLEDGRLVFSDSKTGMRRVLRKKGKFIYTYGPEFDAAEPVEGSITFLPHEHSALDLPSRIMWLPPDPPMKIGVMEDWPELPWEMEGERGSIGSVK